MLSADKKVFADSAKILRSFVLDLNPSFAHLIATNIEMLNAISGEDAFGSEDRESLGIDSALHSENLRHKPLCGESLRHGKVKPLTPLQFQKACIEILEFNQRVFSILSSSSNLNDWSNNLVVPNPEKKDLFDGLDSLEMPTEVDLSTFTSDCGAMSNRIDYLMNEFRENPARILKFDSQKSQ